VKHSSGFYQQDFFKIVIENVADIDKLAQIKVLRQEFWEFAKCMGWRACKDPEREFTARLAINAEEDSRASAASPTKPSLNYVLPSDAVHGNVLEAINSALNILEKHYMDRDLQRTGNSIVLISVGSGLFKVKPHLAQITKQRMLDNAFGIDFVSLSRPPVHVVPLFLVDCKAEGFRDFYEMPHWIRVSYLDCTSPPPQSSLQNR
jgi:DEP domain-containing protein 5